MMLLYTCVLFTSSEGCWLLSENSQWGCTAQHGTCPLVSAVKDRLPWWLLLLLQAFYAYTQNVYAYCILIRLTPSLHYKSLWYFLVNSLIQLMIIISFGLMFVFLFNILSDVCLPLEQDEFCTIGRVLFIQYTNTHVHTHMYTHIHNMQGLNSHSHLSSCC